MSATLTLGEPARLRRPGMAWGVAVSVVLHAMLIFGYRLTSPQAPAELPPREAMTVWLVPPPRPPAPAVVQLEPPPVKQVQPREREKKVEVAPRQQAGATGHGGRQAVAGDHLAGADAGRQSARSTVSRAAAASQTV